MVAVLGPVEALPCYIHTYTYFLAIYFFTFIQLWMKPLVLQWLLLGRMAICKLVLLLLSLIIRT
jgi:hypothetical protein